MTNRNQDSNCSSFNNKTMFDDFNGFVGGSRNSFSGKSNMPINWSNAKGMSKGMTIEEKVIVDPIQSTGLAEGDCGTVQCYCPNGEHKRGKIRFCNTNCDRCFELACKSLCRGGARAKKTKRQTQNFTGKSNMPINWSNAKGMSKAPKKSVVPIKNTGLSTGNCGSMEVTCPDGSYHKVNVTNCTSGDCDKCFAMVTASVCKKGGSRKQKNTMTRKPETKNFTGMGSTFPKGSGSYFDGNNRMRQGRAMDNGGLRLR